MDRVAREEVLAAAGGAGALADCDQVEDGADVGEERIVTLACEDGRAVGKRVDPLGREGVVVRGRPRADVVGRSQQTWPTTLDLPLVTFVTVYDCCVLPRKNWLGRFLNRK